MCIGRKKIGRRGRWEKDEREGEIRQEIGRWSMCKRSVTVLVASQVNPVESKIIRLASSWNNITGELSV